MRDRRFAAAMAALALAAGCSIFEPGDPEDPDPSSFTWQQPYQYTTVISNLDVVMENLSPDFYMLCYDTSFVFIADEEDSSQFSWDFSNWDYIQEQTAINLIMGEAIAESSAVSVNFLEPSDPNLQDPVDYEDTIAVYRDYNIYFESSGYPAATGRAYIHMGKPAETSGLWSIYRWEDNRLEDHDPEEDLTWGVFKGYYLFTNL